LLAVIIVIFIFVIIIVIVIVIITLPSAAVSHYAIHNSVWSSLFSCILVTDYRRTVWFYERHKEHLIIG